MPDNKLERLRLRYRPAAIRLLFIGESPPANGTFFYTADSNLYCYTRMGFVVTFGDTVGSGSDFLDTFQSLGCYLDDLCSTPLNRLKTRQREHYRERSVSDLAIRIASASPQEVIVVMKGIVPAVSKAVSLANVDLKKFHTLPFPAQGHQKEYVNGLKRILVNNQPGFLKHPPIATTTPGPQP